LWKPTLAPRIMRLRHPWLFKGGHHKGVPPRNLDSWSREVRGIPHIIHGGRWIYNPRVANRLKRYYGGYSISLLPVVIAADLCLRARGVAIFILKTFEQTRRRYGFMVVGYVVMPEHVHLLISEPEKSDPSVEMQVLQQRFARAVLRMRRARGENTSVSLAWDAGRTSHLGASFLRFCGVERGKAGGVATLYASQSGQARTINPTRSTAPSRTPPADSWRVPLQCCCRPQAWLVPTL
jgi:REP element-mobilizing transposase RayT